MILIHNLSKKYNQEPVLSDLELEIRRGETLVILGRSGAGKSVLLKLMCRNIDPDKGSIDIDGIRITDIHGAELYKMLFNIGMLFQGSALFDSMTVAENVAFFLSEHGDVATGHRYSEEEISSRVAQALAMVDLSGTERKMPSELSGGMRKRVALARVIVYHPSILLYDEPTTGLDPLTAMQINELIVKTQETLKTTSIVVTHDIFSALCIGDRLALIKEGKIAYIASPDAFMQIDDPTIDCFRKTISQDPRKLRKR